MLLFVLFCLGMEIIDSRMVNRLNNYFVSLCVCLCLCVFVCRIFLFFLYSLESGYFWYHSSGASFSVGAIHKEIPEYKDSDGVVIAVEVDMNQFVVVNSFIFFMFLFFLNRRTAHFFRDGSPFPYHVTGLPFSVCFGV
jgi:hypothetical protein